MALTFNPMVFNKLVRDKIPSIIETQGEKAHTKILFDEEYARALEEKLDEEVREFHESKSIEELSDVLEVVCALCKAQGSTLEELQTAYCQKHAERGGFDDKIWLISKE